MLAFQAADIYQVQAFRGHEKQYLRLASAWSVVFLIVIGVSFFAKAGEQFSRVWLGSFYVIGLLAAGRFRRALFLLVRRWTQRRPPDAPHRDRRRRRSRRSADRRRCKRQKNSDIADHRPVRRPRRRPRRRRDRRRAASSAPSTTWSSSARRTRVDLVIFSLPISAEGRILQMLKKLWVLPVDIRLAAHTNKLRFRPRSYSYIGNVPVLDVFDRPIADWDVVMKWLFDKIVGGAAADRAAPLMALIALAIKLDSRGPVLFKQKRYGFNNELIEVYKFRSMYADQADATAVEARHQGRSARHPRRPLHPQDQPRRAAAALQRGVQGQPVAGRPAPARGQRQGRGPAL